jgi:hypothetical protein
MKSKSSPPSSGTEDSPATVLEVEALEEANTLACFLFLSTTISSESAGGGDVVELVEIEQAVAKIEQSSHSKPTEQNVSNLQSRSIPKHPHRSPKFWPHWLTIRDVTYYPPKVMV